MNYPLYIDLGTNIDPEWLGCISFSSDNITWDNIPLSGLGVSGHIIKGSTDSILIKSASEAHVTITNGKYEILHIELSKVLNQPTWTNDSTGLKQAISDISDWAKTESSIGLATEATLEAVRVLVSSLDSKDYSTETTLAAIKSKTDLLTFTADKLKTTGEDGAGGGSSISEKLLQVDSIGTTTYLGYASAGTLVSASFWAIKKIVETGSDVSITWADGDNSFDNVWNDRLILSYA